MIHIIAITGGIGSGKSVVSRLLRSMQYIVYDCDHHARQLMTSDALLRRQLTDLLGPGAYTTDAQGHVLLQRAYVAQRIFADPDMRSRIDACVHPAVARHMQSCILEAERRGHTRFFFESAILFESGFHQLVVPHQIWTVSAPLQLRIRRAMQRDGATLQQVRARIDAQLLQEDKERLSHHTLINDDCHSLIAQVRQLLS